MQPNANLEWEIHQCKAKLPLADLALALLTGESISSPWRVGWPIRAQYWSGKCPEPFILTFFYFRYEVRLSEVLHAAQKTAVLQVHNALRIWVSVSFWINYLQCALSGSSISQASLVKWKKANNARRSRQNACYHIPRIHAFLTSVSHTEVLCFSPQRC